MYALSLVANQVVAYLHFPYHKTIRSISLPNQETMRPHFLLSELSLSIAGSLELVYTLLPQRNGMGCIFKCKLKFSGTHLHIWVEKGSVELKFLVEEHCLMTPT